MLLSDHQTALPVISSLSVHGDKQLAQKVHLNFSSLALMAVVIYGVKQSFLLPWFLPASVQMLLWSTLLQTVHTFMCRFTLPTYETSITSQWKAGVGTATVKQHNGQSQSDAALESRELPHPWPQSRVLPPDQILCTCVTRDNTQRGAQWNTPRIRYKGKVQKCRFMRSYRVISLSFMDYHKPLKALA